MFVNIDKKSVLFFKAYEDLWAAERVFVGSPNIAVWHCTQAIEKTLKGFLLCNNIPCDETSHDIEPLLEEVVSVIAISDECKANVLNISIYKSGLRYRNLSSDPTVEDAKTIISRAKQIMQEIGANPRTSQFMSEAKEVHIKMLESSLKQHGDA